MKNVFFLLATMLMMFCACTKISTTKPNTTTTTTAPKDTIKVVFMVDVTDKQDTIMADAKSILAEAGIKPHSDTFENVFVQIVFTTISDVTVNPIDVYNSWDYHSWNDYIYTVDTKLNELKQLAKTSTKPRTYLYSGINYVLQNIKLDSNDYVIIASNLMENSGKFNCYKSQYYDQTYSYNWFPDNEKQPTITVIYHPKNEVDDKSFRSAFLGFEYQVNRSTFAKDNLTTQFLRFKYQVRSKYNRVKHKANLWKLN